MRVEAGWFVTYLEGQRYVLGSTDVGIRPAVTKSDTVVLGSTHVRWRMI